MRRYGSRREMGSTEALEGRLLLTTTFTSNEGDSSTLRFVFTAADLNLSELAFYESTSGTIEAVNHPTDPTYYILYPNNEDLLDGPFGPFSITISGEDEFGNTGSLELTWEVLNVSPQFTNEEGYDGGLAYLLEVEEGGSVWQDGYWYDPGLNGDGTTITASAGTLTVEPNGSWSWELSSVTTSQTVTLTATDKDGGTTEFSFDISVTNLPPVLEADFYERSLTEGDIAAGMGTWSDPGEDEVTLSCSIGSIFQYPDGTWVWMFNTVDGPNDSQYVTITAIDSEGGESSFEFSMDVSNAPPIVTADQPASYLGNDQVFRMTGTITDPGTIWGDWISITASFGILRHEFDTPNQWVWSYDSILGLPPSETVTITAYDKDGGTSEITFPLVASNYQPKSLKVSGGSATEDQPFVLTGSFTDFNGGDEHTIFVDWGDGTSESVVLPIGNRSFVIPHTYHQSSVEEEFESYGISIAVSDDGGTTRIKSDTLAQIEMLPGPELVPVLQSQLSPDGRFVLITTDKDEIVPEDANCEVDVYLKNLQTGEILLISRNMGGASGNGSSYGAAISADNRYVAFYSHASDLVLNDTNDASDIFVYDILTRNMRRASVDSNGNEGNGNSYLPSISFDGDQVIFESEASNLIDEDENCSSDIFVHHLSSGITELVSRSTIGDQGNRDSWGAVISGNGRYVVYTSESDNLDIDDPCGGVFLFDLLTGETRRILMEIGGAPVAGSSVTSISADGRYIAFESDTNNLVSNDHNSRFDAFVFDTQDNTILLISVTPGGESGNRQSSNPIISSDGRFVVFESLVNTLVPGDSNDSNDVFVRDLLTGTTTLLSTNSNGGQGAYYSMPDSISGDGRYITFYSASQNFEWGDNGGSNTFLVSNPVFASPRVTVAEVNDAPVLVDGGTPVLDGVGLNAVAEGIAGTLVSDLIARMGPNGGISDSDNGAVYGVAINGTTGNGTGVWQYSIDAGTTWENVGIVNNEGARLLAAETNTRVRYVPNAGFMGEVKIAFTAWDRTVGLNGGLGVTKNRGGSSTFSLAYEYASLFVTNSAPVLNDSGSPMFDSILGGVEDTHNSGTSVSDLLARMGPTGGVTDSNPNTIPGIAINGLTGTATGVWEYTVNNGTNWTPIGTTGNSNARLLAADANTRIRYRPNLGFLGEVKIAFAGWDRTSGANGGVTNVGTRGGTTAYSSVYEYASLFVMNSAPVLIPSHAAYLDSIPKNISNGANHGTLVSDLIVRIGSGGVTDPNPGALTGIAVNGLVGTLNGTWQYSVDGGTSWSSIGTTGNSNARLLASNANTRVRFVPNAGFTGTVKLAFVAWDQTTGVNGGMAAVGTRGGTRAYSSLYDYASLSVV